LESIKEENLEFIISGLHSEEGKFQEILYKKFFGYAPERRDDL